MKHSITFAALSTLQQIYAAVMWASILAISSKATSRRRHCANSRYSSPPHLGLPPRRLWIVTVVTWPLREKKRAACYWLNQMGEREFGSNPTTFHTDDVR